MKKNLNKLIQKVESASEKVSFNAVDQAFLDAYLKSKNLNRLNYIANLVFICHDISCK